MEPGIEKRGGSFKNGYIYLFGGGACMEVRASLLDWFSLTHESWAQTQVTRPCDKHLYSLSHLTTSWQDLDFEASWVVE